MAGQDQTYVQAFPPDFFKPSPSDISLNIGIVGAGIAGLNAATALARAGHNVELFERSRFSNEVGAAINIQPNASRILEYHGFNWAGAKALETAQGNIYNGITLKSMVANHYEDYPSIYGSRWYLLHRVDLHSELRRLALDPGEGYNPATINLSSEVVDVDCEAGVLVLKDGRRVKKDLIVGADGVHSLLAKKVVGHIAEPHETGTSAFRFLVPMKNLLDDERVKYLFDVPVEMGMAVTNTERLVWYPCRGGELMNFVAIHPDRVDSAGKEEWNVGAKIEWLLDSFKDFHPDVIETLKKAEDLKLWKLLYRAPMSPWIRGKVVLIGDAAHPMLPHQGQGGSQAIEDGAALGLLLWRLKSLDDLSERLGMFYDLRKNRTAAIQIFSNAGQEEAWKTEEAARPFVEGKVPTTQKDFHAFNYRWNVYRECLRAMTEKGFVGNDEVAES